MRGNNSGNGDGKGYQVAPSSSGKVMAPHPLNNKQMPQKQMAGDLRMSGKKIK